jgi:GNAT superfamily N-acetyltransferase
MKASQQPVIRPVATDDYDAWKVLWDGYNEFYGRHGETALPDVVTQTTWGRFFAADEPVYGLVAEGDDGLLGIAHYLFHRTTTHIEPTCYLNDLFTVKTARGQGVGRALIEAVCERASIEGAQEVYWHTHETNSTARRLYDYVAERSGFIEYEKSC